MKQLIISIDAETKNQFKSVLASEGRSICDFLRGEIDDYLSKSNAKSTAKRSLTKKCAC